MKQTYIMALTAAMLWSTAYVGVKIGLEYAEPFFFAGSRFMLSGILIIPFVGRMKGYFAFFRENWRVVIPVGAFQTGIFYALYFQGINRVPAAVAAIVRGAEPLFTATTAHMLMHNDKFTLRKVISLIGAVIGVVLLSAQRDFGDPSGLRELAGIALMLGACFTGSFGQVIVKKKALNPVYLNSQQIFIGGLMILLLSVLTGESVPTEVPLTFLAALLWLSFVSACAFTIWYSLLKRPEVKVSEVNLFKFIIPVSGAVLSWLIMPEDTPDLISVVGMVLIAGSIILFYARKEKLPPAVRKLD